MGTTPVREDVLGQNELFIRVGETVEPIGAAHGVRFDRQTMAANGDGEGDDAGESDDGSVPQLVFVGGESYRTRIDDPRDAIGIELMGRDRWTIGFLDRTTNRYIAILDEDVVESFVEMVDAVETLRFALSFPESPEAEGCPDCQGTDHLNHVYDIDTAAGEEFIAEVMDLVGNEITGRR